MVDAGVVLGVILGVILGVVLGVVLGELLGAAAQRGARDKGTPWGSLGARPPGMRLGAWGGHSGACHLPKEGEGRARSEGEGPYRS